MGYVDKPSIEQVAFEYFGEVNDEFLEHYGIKRRSGRYPWGSGEDPYQHSGDFLSRVEQYKKQGLKDNEIAKAMGMTSTTYRAMTGIANDERRSLLVDRAKSLRADGLSLNEITKEMGYKNDSSVRALLNVDSEIRMNQAKNAADLIRKSIEEKGMIDVGKGVDIQLGISKEKLDQALLMLEIEGYPVYGGRVEQATNSGKKTTIKVICPKGTEHKDIFSYDIHSIDDYVSYDKGETFKPSFVYPKSMDSKRLAIRYAEDGGIKKDGIIEIRRGVPDLSLGESHYAQVRILVDGKKYIKGMAIYSDDLPDGVDVMFNTNKRKDVPKLEVLKDIKTDDPMNPFGSTIKEHGGQHYYKDKNGKEQLSLINKTREEGDWLKWSNTLSSQFLSKQPLKLAKKQLDLAKEDKQMQFEDIMALNNPTVKRKLLLDFADECDSAAVKLRGAALPRQKYHVIIPVTTLKDNEVYAPNYKNGEKVCLVRYPHGGTFEIPELVVNNKHKDARKILGTTTTDAIGINSHVAERLSGADFDGDTVMVIPQGKGVKIKTTPPLKGLEGFDPKLQYGTKKVGNDYYNERGEKIKTMSKKLTQTEMGKVSNLITDMTLKNATEDELARAVRHSMVVIDAEKHKLDYRSSAKDNAIEELKKKYQEGGASTIISRAKGTTSVDKRQGSPTIDPETGKLKWKTTDDLYYETTKVNKRTGEVTTTTKKRQQKITNMDYVEDAYELVSRANTPMERYYAEYANSMKRLANEARKASLNVGKVQRSSTAAKTYATEVKSLDEKLMKAEANKPRERMAQIQTTLEVNAKIQANPDMDKSAIKKAKQQALSRHREALGARREPVEVSEKEWEAIQAGAISDNKLTRILKNADMDVIKQYATPKTYTTITPAKANKIKALKASGYTTAEIAERLGVSTSTVQKYMN
jgi:hypothetical protein|nr:MAG TPA: RNA dependent RNA polymerase [Caudoviricetes sp.]